MYRVLIVDDELRALRYVQHLIDKFSSGYTIAGCCTSGEQAMELLSRTPVDLLITDITMRGMNGIELAKQARSLYPGIHILIISGYGEFEYAQGAIQAGVEDYLLKPVNVSKLVALLESIKSKLDTRQAERIASFLPAIACRQFCPLPDTSQLFTGNNFRFALIRWGNLDMTMPQKLAATSYIQPPHEKFHVLRGRDGNERILIGKDSSADTFLSDLSVYTAQPGNQGAWTAVYSVASQEIHQLPDFIDSALNVLYCRTVIGKYQILQINSNTHEERMRISAADLKQLSYFISVGKHHLIKDYFFALATEWSRNQVPQRHIWHMGRQLIHQIASSYAPAASKLEEILLEFNELILCAGTYGDLMASLYSLLLEDGKLRDKKLSAKALYDYTIQYISENYAQPLSTRSVCEELGISQTYLSRLFRKYSDTTFNAYLTQCRMEAAKSLLLEKPDFLLRDIAACVGYEDSSYFTQVFHRYTGMTPTQYVSENS